MFKKPLFWSNVAAFLVTGLVVAGVALAWNSPSAGPTAANGAISADSSGNAVLTGLCFGVDCRGSWPMSNIQVFNATGNWTVPVGVKKITVEVWGGGAGGASAITYGGGGGGYGKSILSVNPGDILAVTVGVGGNNAGAGVPGGTTSVVRSGTTLISATGGGVGGGGSFYIGGTSSAIINITGGSGGAFKAADFGNGYWDLSVGGSAPLGGAGGFAGSTGIGGSCATTGISPGGGGASATEGCYPGAGANGRVVIYY